MASDYHVSKVTEQSKVWLDCVILDSLGLESRHTYLLLSCAPWTNCSNSPSLDLLLCLLNLLELKF